MFKKVALALCLLGLASENASAAISTRDAISKELSSISRKLNKVGNNTFTAAIAFIGIAGIFNLGSWLVKSKKKQSQ